MRCDDDGDGDGEAMAMVMGVQPSTDWLWV
jgi:hypothetical protein